jgi:predicted DNA-binding transcriptional regulator AlpA
MENQVQNRTGKGLPRYVGVKEVCEASGCSKSTLDRLRRDKLFPQAEQISPNRVGWKVEVIEEHLATQARCVAKLGVADPATLEPDLLIDSARDLIAQAMSKRDGKPVDPKGMSIHTSRSVTLDEFKAAEAREFALYAKRFAHFGEGRAAVLAAWLFPALRPLIEDAAIDEVSRQLFQSPELLRALGSRTLHDDDWEQAEAMLVAAIGPVN